MLSIAQHRSMYAKHLHGKGVEFGPLDGPVDLPPGVTALYADHRSTEQLKARYPTISGIHDVNIVLTGSDLPQIEPESLDFAIACQVIEHLPNPIGGLEVWSSKVTDHGTVYITFPIGKWCPDKCRPINTLEHLIYDYENKTSRCTDEDRIAFLWAWNPGQFPDPAGMEAGLKYVWDNQLLEFDAKAWELFGESNKVAIEHGLEGKDDEIHHHVFDMDLLLQSVEWLNKRLPYVLAPIEIGYGKGLLNECILILRRYPKTFADTPNGKAVLDAHRRHIASSLATESWTEEYVIEINEFVQFQRRVLDERLSIIEAA